MMNRALLVLLLLAPLPAVAACPPGLLEGEVTYVRDGDTLELGPMAIRLNGVAAPEWDAPGGREATDALEWLALGKVLSCELDGTSTYDRCAAICYLLGTDVALTLVRQGVARDCPRYSGGRYQQAELQAALGGATIGETYRLPGYCRPRRRNVLMRRLRGS